MKNLWFLCLVASLGAVSAAGYETSARNRYRFEPKPNTPFSAGEIFSRDPKLAVRASGALYLLGVYGQQGESRLGLAVSHDGGDSFEPPVQISEPGARVNSHGENSPSLAFGATEVYALWEQAAPEGGTDLMFARSISFGRKFEKPIRMTDKTVASTNAFSFLAATPAGPIIAAWLDGRDNNSPAGTLSLFLAKSTDRGSTFGKNTRVATGVCPCCRPQIGFGAGGEIFLAWRHVFPGDVRDIVLAVSTHGGETFSPPTRVHEDNWIIHGCPHSGPSLAAREGRLFVSWFSEGDGTNPGIRLARSDDGGRSFSGPLLVSKAVLDANHPSLSVSGDGAVYLVFQGRDPAREHGWGAIRPYLVEIGDAGASEPVAIPGSQKSVAYPSLLSSTLGRVFIAWTERGDSGNRIMLIRGRKSH